MTKPTELQLLIRVALMTALISVGAYITIPLPVLPFTLQVLFVLLSAMLLGPCGALSCGLYLALGLAGMPIFAGGGGGIGSLLSPSFGFLLGFVPASAVCGLICRRVRGLTGYLLGGASAIAVIHIMGGIYFWAVINLVQETPMTLLAAFGAASLPYLPVDLLKCGLACAVARRLRSAALPAK